LYHIIFSHLPLKDQGFDHLCRDEQKQSEKGNHCQLEAHGLGDLLKEIFCCHVDIVLKVL